jgi:uncharacterized repeat protein (TIGR03847 family)
MESELQDFGRADLFDAEAIGRPGQRRFRLFGRSHRGTASLWLEREQMEVLSQALEQLLAQIVGGVVLRKMTQGDLAKPPGAPDDFPEHADVDFRVSRLTIGFDEDEDIILILATPFAADGESAPSEDAQPQFATRISRHQATDLATHIAGAIAAGRPRCPLCGEPLDPPHVCVKQNGYHPVELN